MITKIIEAVYNFLWGDLFTIPLGSHGSLGIPLLVVLLIPTGIFFMIRTKFLPIRMFPDMIKAVAEKNEEKNGLSSVQTLIVSTLQPVKRIIFYFSSCTLRSRFKPLIYRALFFKFI